MTTFLREFGSWYWECEFDDAVLQAAFDATGTAESADDFRRAFLVLLRSDDVAARGVALDFYDRAGATSRFGEENPFGCFHDEVMAVAREMLAGPPRPEDDIAFAGAEHASAPLAIKNDVRSEDGAAVLAVLRRRPDGSLLSNALSVAGAVLSISDEPRLAAVIGEMAFDSSRDVRDPARTGTGWTRGARGWRGRSTRCAALVVRGHTGRRSGLCCTADGWRRWASHSTTSATTRVSPGSA
jgi:hypothetical protein